MALPKNPLVELTETMGEVGLESVHIVFSFIFVVVMSFLDQKESLMADC